MEGNIFDYCALGIILISVTISMLRGFVAEGIALVRWIIALVLAKLFYLPLSAMIAPFFEKEQISIIVAFVLIFILVFILMQFLKKLLIQVVETLDLNSVNRLLGGVLGLIKAGILLTVAVLIMSFTPLPKQQEWQVSILIPYFEQLSALLVPYLPENVLDKVSPKSEYFTF